MGTAEIHTRKRWRTRHCVIAMFVVVVVIAGWWCMRADGKIPIRAIVTVQALSLGDYGTVRMRHHIKIEGSPIVVRIGKRSGNSVFVYQEDRYDPSIAESILGRTFGDETSGSGSYELVDFNKGRRFQLFAPSGPIELKPGESYTLATCTNANGERVELFVSCE